MTDTSFRVEPVAGALGAQIHGVDLALPLSDETFEAIRDALHEYLVIFFRDQDLTAEQHCAFARRLGPLEPHPYVQGLGGHPDIIEIVKEPEEAQNFGSGWHADLTFLEQPPGGAVLYARDLPPVGGDTMFANMYLAYETLSHGMRRMLEGLSARHASGEPEIYSAEFRGMRERGDTDAIEQVHPVVRTHPVTGRMAIFVNPVFTRRFEAMTMEESAPVLRYLHEHATRPEFTFRFRWSPGTLLIWDNRVVLHNALNDDFGAARNGMGFRRVLHRATLAGERPV
jgi:taurine dioxygenase